MSTLSILILVLCVSLVSRESSGPTDATLSSDIVPALLQLCHQGLLCFRQCPFIRYGLLCVPSLEREFPEEHVLAYQSLRPLSHWAGLLHYCAEAAGQTLTSAATLCPVRGAWGCGPCLLWHAVSNLEGACGGSWLNPVFCASARPAVQHPSYDGSWVGQDLSPEPKLLRRGAVQGVVGDARPPFPLRED